MARPSTNYEPRDPAGTALHRIVKDHLETFLEQASQLRDVDGVPPFVERAFRGFLRCGFLAGGFARFRCGGCALDRLVAFSCKGRAVCPSCGDHGRPVGDGELDSWTHRAPVLADLAAASVQGLVALGPHSGTRVRRFGHAREVMEPRVPGPCHARWNGLDLHAGLVVPAGQRVRLERLCRYVLRPPITSERLTLTADGQVRLALKHPWADGTTHVVFDPVEFLGRLAVIDDVGISPPVKV